MRSTNLAVNLNSYTPHVVSFTLERDPQVQSVLHITLHDALGIPNRSDFKKVVLDEIERGVTVLVIDCQQCGYIDPTGLGVLVSLRKKCHGLGGSVSLTHLNDDLKTLFALTHLDTLFDIGS